MSTTLPQIETGALTALLTSAAFAPIGDLGWIRVTGSDRVRWLNGMVTNSIQSLTPGQGCYNFVLNAQGRIQGDLTAFALEESLLLETGSSQVETLLAYFDRFIIMDDVELTDLSAARSGLLVAGPGAPALLTTLLGELPSPLSCLNLVFHGESLTLIHAHSPLVPRFELWAAPETITLLTTTLRDRKLPLATPESLNQLRLLEGAPLYGTDIRDKDLPQETATVTTPSRALHFAKGCYLGQEIVERIRSRGNVHRAFSGFLLTGDLPSAGTPLTAADTPDKPVGELTSTAVIPLPSGAIQVALGYIRREALDRNASLTYPGGKATPASMPFADAQSQNTESASDQEKQSQE